jgi:hypothetical protein
LVEEDPVPVDDHIPDVWMRYQLLGPVQAVLPGASIQVHHGSVLVDAPRSLDQHERNLNGSATGILGIFRHFEPTAGHREECLARIEWTGNLPWAAVG